MEQVVQVPKIAACLLPGEIEIDGVTYVRKTEFANDKEDWKRRNDKRDNRRLEQTAVFEMRMAIPLRMPALRMEQRRQIYSLLTATTGAAVGK